MEKKTLSKVSSLDSSSKTKENTETSKTCSQGTQLVEEMGLIDPLAVEAEKLLIKEIRIIPIDYDGIREDFFLDVTPMSPNSKQWQYFPDYARYTIYDSQGHLCLEGKDPNWFTEINILASCPSPLSIEVQACLQSSRRLTAEECGLSKKLIYQVPVPLPGNDNYEAVLVKMRANEKARRDLVDDLVLQSQKFSSMDLDLSQMSDAQKSLWQTAKNIPVLSSKFAAISSSDYYESFNEEFKVALEDASKSDSSGSSNNGLGLATSASDSLVCAPTEIISSQSSAAGQTTFPSSINTDNALIPTDSPSVETISNSLGDDGAISSSGDMYQESKGQNINNTSIIGYSLLAIGGLTFLWKVNAQKKINTEISKLSEFAGGAERIKFEGGTWKKLENGSYQEITPESTKPKGMEKYQSKGEITLKKKSISNLLTDGKKSSFLMVASIVLGSLVTANIIDLGLQEDPFTVFSLALKDFEVKRSQLYEEYGTLKEELLKISQKSMTKSH